MYGSVSLSVPPPRQSQFQFAVTEADIHRSAAAADGSEERGMYPMKKLSCRAKIS